MRACGCVYVCGGVVVVYLFDISCASLPLLFLFSLRGIALILDVQLPANCEHHVRLK